MVGLSEPSPVDEPANNEAVEEKPYPIPPEKQEEEALFPRNADRFECK